MLEIKGTFATAKVFAKTVDDTAIEQIELLCSQEFTKGAKIRIMPDVHAGKGCTIGFTANLGDMVIPNIVGVDIGCGMLCVKLGRIDVDFNRFDEIVRKSVPYGREVHPGRITKYPKLQEMNCYRTLKDTKRVVRSLGTLGGGNHFIELDKDEDGVIYLVIHTGSRNLGKQVAELYQKLAYDIARGADKLFETQQKLIDDYKAQGRRREIQSAII
ncbi:MAG: RtcB family protein, partial [Eubacterium sp.]|nr:RtcB family protein [Eubacterium sp.]